MHKHILLFSNKLFWNFRSDNPHLGRSQGSLDSDEKPMESDSDSLEEYEDQDASKFNEDGSFIGQYTGKRKSGSTKPSAINTSV